jgi:hypothetical protein
MIQKYKLFKEKEKFKNKLWQDNHVGDNKIYSELNKRRLNLGFPLPYWVGKYSISGLPYWGVRILSSERTPIFGLNPFWIEPSNSSHGGGFTVRYPPSPRCPGSLGGSILKLIDFFFLKNNSNSNRSICINNYGHAG